MAPSVSGGFAIGDGKARHLAVPAEHGSGRVGPREVSDLMQSGHRSVPHTADTRIEAWASTREFCVAEAVTAMVEAFADISGARQTDTAAFEVAEDSDEDLLVEVLAEVIYLMDTADVVPLRASIAPAEEEGYDVRFEVTGVDQIEVIGAVPKAVSLHGLRFAEHADGWSCSVTLDV
jgi:SHS2 domain-containing protein